MTVAEQSIPHAAQIADIVLVAALRHQARVVEIAPASASSHRVVFHRQGRAVASAFLPRQVGQTVIERFRYIADLDPIAAQRQSSSWAVRMSRERMQLFMSTHGSGPSSTAELWLLHAGDDSDVTLGPLAGVTPLRSGDLIGPLRILGQIGAGGMGLVYHAHHVWLDRPCAVKILRPEYANDPPSMERFFVEARLAARTEGSGSVAVLDVGTLPDGRPYIVMELIEGCSVEELVHEEGALDPYRAARLVRDSARALADLHDRGVVHCDVTASNIFVCASDGTERIKLSDFGSARDRDLQAESSDIVFGTPLYMAPEQIRGLPCDGRTDLYSLGIVFFELIAGHVPFDGDSVVAIAKMHLSQEPPPLTSPYGPVPRVLDQIVRRLLDKSPDDRYQSAAELAEVLDRVLAGGKRTTVRIWCHIHG